MASAAAHLLAASVLAAMTTGDPLPDLMTRAVIPATDALPTCADIVEGGTGERDRLVVGLSDGSVIAVTGVGDKASLRRADLGSGLPVDDVCAATLPRVQGSGTESIAVAVCGRDLFLIGLSSMEILSRSVLPKPSGTYTVSTLVGTKDGSDGAGSRRDQILLHDEHSLAQLVIDSKDGFAATVRPLADDVARLRVTHLVGRTVAAMDDRVAVLPPAGSVELAPVEPCTHEALRGTTEIGCVIPCASSVGDTLLLVAMEAGDGRWFHREVALPGSLSVVESLSDTLLAVGGWKRVGPGYLLGWIALVSGRGEIVAEGEHAARARAIAAVGPYLAVQGEGRCFSLYGKSLRPVWDHNSPVATVALLTGDFFGDAADDVAVVGARTYRVDSEQVDAIRETLGEPDFMASGTIEGDRYILVRTLIQVFTSNAGRLDEVQEEETRASQEAHADGRDAEAVARAMRARSAAATLGRHDDVEDLTRTIAFYASTRRRNRAWLTCAVVLGILGGVVALARLRRSASAAEAVAAGLVLVAAGAVSWRLLGTARPGPILLFGGGIAAGVGLISVAVRGRGYQPAPTGADVEKLIDLVMGFVHAGHTEASGRQSSATTKKARKTVTSVASLAREILAAGDDPERLAVPRADLSDRAQGFRSLVVIPAARLAELGRTTHFLPDSFAAMSESALVMESALGKLLGQAPLDPEAVRGLVRTIVDSRQRIVEHAEEAYAQVSANPGCSLRSVLTRLCRDKTEALAGSGVLLECVSEAPHAGDAVRLWHDQLYTILENLVSNAARLMPGRPRKTISVLATAEASTSTIVVRDSGPGMTARKLAALFDGSEDPSAAGYCLPFARRVLGDYGGSIEVESVLGEGTTFTIMLLRWSPRATGETDGNEAEAPAC